MKNKSWILDVIEDEATGDSIITFPEDFLAETGWREGDVIEWIDNNDGTWSIKKKFKCISKVKFGLPGNLTSYFKDLASKRSVFNTDYDQGQSFKEVFKLVAHDKIEDTEIYDQKLGTTYLVKKETLEDIKNRLDNNNPNWRKTITGIVEVAVDPEIEKQVLACLPEKLLEHNPRVCMQTLISRSKNSFLPPHKDHARTSNLIYMFESQGEQTTWYEPTEYFQDHREWMVADTQKIKAIHQEQIEPNTWYVFDNATYHGVGPIDTPKTRTALCIEFPTLPADKLYELIQE
jgi:hypothetical protein